MPRQLSKAGMGMTAVAIAGAIIYISSRLVAGDPSPEAARSGNNPPRVLTSLIEEREAEIIAAKLRLAQAGLALMQALRTKRDTLESSQVEWKSFEERAPLVQALVGYLPHLPRPVDHAHLDAEIERTREEFTTEKERYQAELGRIEDRYRRELAPFTGHEGFPSLTLPQPAAPSDKWIVLGEELLRKLEAEDAARDSDEPATGENGR